MNNTTGKRISELLTKQNISQRELGKRIGTTEVSISRYINGTRTPNGPMIATIASALNTTTDYLLGNEKTNDFEVEYQNLCRLVARNAPYMTLKQKRELINVLLED